MDDNTFMLNAQIRALSEMMVNLSALLNVQAKHIEELESSVLSMEKCLHKVLAELDLSPDKGFQYNCSIRRPQNKSN